MINKDTDETGKKMETHLHDCRLRIGDTIREIRKKKGYSQEQLAEIMNVRRTTISKIENGKFNFSLDYLSRFSWFLDFNIAILKNKVQEKFHLKD